MSLADATQDNRIATAIASGDAALKAFNGALDLAARLEGPNKERFSLEAPIPGYSPPISIASVSARLAASIQLLQSLATIPNTLLIPEQDIVNLLSRSGEVKTHADRLATSVNEFINGGNVTSLDVTGLSASNAAGHAINIGQLTSALFAPSQNLLSVVRGFLLDRSGPEMPGLAVAMSELNAMRSELRAIGSEIAATQKSVARSEKGVLSIYQSAEQTKVTIADLEHEATKLRDSLIEGHQSAVGQMQNIASVNESARALKQVVAEYQSEFDKFMSAMTLRERQFTEGTESFTKLQSRTTEAMNELDRLVTRARAVLGEATVAGLSDRFKTEADSLNTRMGWILVMLFAGVALFFFSAGLALDMIPFARSWISMPTRVPPLSEGAWQNLVYMLTSVLGKVILLLPSLILIGFSVKWYAALFKLRKEYAYKYTVAASLPGFKIEAPTFSEAVTAIAIQELMHNPEDSEGAEKGKGTKSESLMHRLTNPFVTKVVDQVISKMGKDGG